jgi:hypothetical protein
MWAHQTRVFYDGNRAQVIEQRLSSPNGLAIDRKRRRLYMSMVNTLAPNTAGVYRTHLWVWLATLPTCVIRSHATVSMESVRAYDILNDNRLRHIQDIHLLTMPDNIYVHAPTGDLWIGAHPVAYKVMSYFNNLDKYTSPSQVVHVKFEVQCSCACARMHNYTHCRRMVSTH